MKKCPYCVEEIQDEAIVCRYCGRELSPTSVQEIESQLGQLKPWYRQTWFYMLTLVFLWPLFLVLLVTDKQISPLSRSLGTIFLIPWAIIIISFIVGLFPDFSLSIGQNSVPSPIKSETLSLKLSTPTVIPSPLQEPIATIRSTSTPSFGYACQSPPITLNYFQAYTPPEWISFSGQLEEGFC